MKSRLLAFLLLPFAMTALSSVGYADNYEGSTIKITGNFESTGPVSVSPYNLNTMVYFGPNGQLELSFGDRKFHTLLNGSPSPVASEHTAHCGKYLVGINREPDYAQASMHDGVVTFSYLIDWSQTIRSSKCEGGKFSGASYLKQEFVVDLKNGCKFRYDVKQKRDNEVKMDFHIDGACTLTR